MTRIFSDTGGREKQHLPAARVVISCGGLAVRRKFDPGLRLRMTLNRGNEQVGPVEFRILHTTERPDGT